MFDEEEEMTTIKTSTMTTTEEGQKEIAIETESFYPWESPTCRDEADEVSCQGFEHLCSILSIVAYRRCRKTCKLCYHDHAQPLSNFP